jgi:UDP-GlcNAc:undecaprenyl-phosphate GlcNAc-1-phosphate transferase
VGPAVIDVVMAAAVGFTVTFVCCPGVLKLLNQLHIVDVPSARSSHLLPTARGGGLACAVGFICAVVLAPDLAAGTRILLVTVGGGMAALGMTDDVRNLGPGFRLSVQTGLAIVGSSWALGLPGTPSAALGLFAVGGAAWIVSYVNAFNFMDGLNGLAATAALLAGSSFAVLGIARSDLALAAGGAALAGTSAAFLPWNFPRARFFLGDVGSCLFGGSISVLVLLGLRAHLPVEALLAPEAVFIADTGWTLCCRLARGEDWRSAHRGHVYQRLHQCGWSHLTTTLALSTLVVFVSLLGMLSLTGVLWVRMIADGLALLLLIGYLRGATILVRRRHPVPPGRIGLS